MADALPSLGSRYQQPDDSFSQLITAGGDERLDVRSQLRNKYYINSLDGQRVFHRASCTCSPLSLRGRVAAEQLYGQLSDGAFERQRRTQVQRIKQLLNMPGCDRFDVFFAPSGSDLCYYPLLFSRLIYPDRPLFNVITCPEELGSGSLLAFQGRYYCSRNQFGEPVNQHESLDPRLEISTLTFPARDSQGFISDHRQQIEDAIHAKYVTHAVIANIVIGSKSGIENNTSMLATAPEDVLWTADLCQFRASRSLINGLIGMNACVMLTGSKFYHAPPFCGILLVPKTLTARFGNPRQELVEPFGSIFAATDIPDTLPDLQACLPDYRNYGLLLRWEAALAEMDAFASLDDYAAREQIRRWNAHVLRAMAANPAFELMPGQEETNKTIISFRLKSGSAAIDYGALTNIYHRVCTQPHNGLRNADQVLIGQPVNYGDRAFLRVALSSVDVVDFVRSGPDYQNDNRLIEILAAHARGET